MKKISSTDLKKDSTTFLIVMDVSLGHEQEDNLSAHKVDAYYVTIVKDSDKWKMSGSDNLQNDVTNWFDIEEKLQQKSDIEILQILKDFKFK